MNDQPTGALMFARYAFPPNALGYCGPDDAGALLDYASCGTADRGLTELAKRFSGAWPYLELIAGSVGREPLDHSVVAAYWIGNSLLEHAHRPSFAASLEQRFKSRAGSRWPHLAPVVPEGGLPHHAFHVFCVYPWVGLLRSGSVDEPLRVLDRCRIRWATVQEADRDRALVVYRPLEWDGRTLGYGPQTSETVRTHFDGASLAGQVRAGDVVSCHWDWVCERLEAHQLRNLQRYSARALGLVNGSRVPAPPAFS